MNFQVKLHFTDEALRLIAKKALAKNTGARGLRSILENLLTEAMYEVWIIVLVGSCLESTVFFSCI